VSRLALIALTALLRGRGAKVLSRSGVDRAGGTFPCDFLTTIILVEVDRRD
jgi:hypothetical protein